MLSQANRDAWMQKSSAPPVSQAELLVKTLILTNESAQPELLSLHEVSLHLTNEIKDDHPLTTWFIAFGSVEGRCLVATHQWLC